MRTFTSFLLAICVFTGIFSQSGLIMMKVVAPATVEQGGKATLQVTIKNMSLTASSASEVISIYHLGGYIPYFQDFRTVYFHAYRASNRIPIGRSIAAGATVTLPLAFTVADTFSHKPPFNPQTNYTEYHSWNPYLIMGTQPNFFDFSYYGLTPPPILPKRIAIDPKTLKANLPTTDLALSAAIIKNIDPQGKFSYKLTIKNKGLKVAKKLNIEALELNAALKVRHVPSTGSVITTKIPFRAYGIKTVWKIPQLAAGASATCDVYVDELNFQLLSLTNDLLNLDFNTRCNQIEDPNPNNDVAQLTFKYKRDALRLISATGPATVTRGGKVTVNVVLKNDGATATSPNEVLAIYRFADDYPNIKASRESNQVPIGRAIQPGTSVTIPVIFTLSDTFSHKPTFADGYLSTSNLIALKKRPTHYRAPLNFRQDTMHIELTGAMRPILPKTDLAITVVKPNPAIPKKGNFKYSVTLSNKGTIEARKAEVLLIEGELGATYLKLRSTPSQGYVYNVGRNYYWNVGTVAAGKQATCVVEVDSSRWNPSYYVTGHSIRISPYANCNQIEDDNFNNDYSPFIIYDPNYKPLNSLQNAVFAFEARSQLNQAHLMWYSNTGYQTDYFEIEKLNPTGDFEKIATLNNTDFDDTFHSYTYTDVLKNTDGTSRNSREGGITEAQYRIKTVRQDGSFTFSDIKTVHFAAFNDALVFPNPATENISVSLKNYENEPVKIVFYNSLGLVLKEMSIEKMDATPLSISIENWQEGPYFMRITAKNKRDVVKKFYVAK